MFCMQCFGFWGSVFGFNILCLVFGVSYFGCLFFVVLILNLAFRVSCLVFQVSCFVFRVLDFEFRFFGFQLSDFGFRVSV